MNADFLAARERWRALLSDHYTPLHPEIQVDLERWIHPAWRAHRRDGSASPWTAVAGRDDILTAPAMTDQWCAAVLAEARSVERFAAAHHTRIPAPNSMNRYGLVLDDLGFAPLLSELVRDWIDPIAQRAYPELELGQLDHHHGFLVDYQIGADEDLSLHVDDSEVTLNLCLGERFEGGALYFLGRRCFGHLETASRPGEAIDILHRPGVGVLHAGKDRHGAEMIESGRRTQLILWCRSSQVRDRPNDPSCPHWCRQERTTPNP